MYIPVELKILRITLIAAAISTFLLMVNDWVNQKYFMTAIELPSILIFLGLLWMTYKDFNKDSIALATSIIALMMLSAAIILNRGFGVGLATLFISTCVMAHIIIHPKHSKGIAAFSILLFTILLLLDFYHPLFSNTSYFDPAYATPKTTIAVLFYTSLLFVTWITSKLKREYHKNYEQLLAKKEEISKINEDLDKLVAERTSSLETEKEKILNYAFMNSHETRAPLSNILMLHEVLNTNKLSDTEKDEVLSKLSNEAIKLDQSIQAMQKKLQKEHSGN